MHFIRILCFVFLLSSYVEGMDDPQAFLKLLYKPAPKWMAEQIESDLAPFTDQLSRKSLDHIFANQKGMMLFRVRIQQGVMRIKKSEGAASHRVTDSIIPHLKTIHELFPLPDCDFLISPHDTIGFNPSDPPWPVMIITKDNRSPGFILMPDWFALKGYEPEKKSVLEGNQSYPWSTKKNILFFRGSDTGVFDTTQWIKYPRPHLVALSLKYPDLIDAKFVKYLHHKSMLEKAKRRGFMGNYISMKDHCSYKYLMDLDGNCASAPRLALLLHSNSVVFKHQTNSIQWFYGKLKAYQHFIPVKKNLGDLLPKIEWAKSHDQECEQISKQARQLAQEVLSHEAIYLYFYKLIETYARKQKPIYNHL